MIDEPLDLNTPIEVYLDSKTVFDIIEKDVSTTERRLFIDAHAFRESYASS